MLGLGHQEVQKRLGTYMLMTMEEMTLGFN